MRSFKTPLLLTVLSLSIFVSGCSQHFLRDVAASSVVKASNKYVSPWFMASSDTDVMCAMGEGMSGMVFPMGPNIDPMIPMVTLASGMCADEKSKEAELRYIRAMRKGDASEALDARVMQQRWQNLAARRQYTGYQAIVRYFGEPGGECPRFETDDQELSYLFGLLNGIQGFQADFASGGVAGIPADTMPKALKGLRCLNSAKYWGVPEAVDALVAIMMAGIGDDKEQLNIAYARLDRASAEGKSQGVRMVQLLEAILYSSQGNITKAKAVIRDHAESKRQVPANPKLKLLDEMATRGIQLVSDKLWTQNTGQRTPYNSLGKFWDDSPVSNAALDIDDLL
ncbi:MAG: hypothetical protein JKY24_04185 [Pseudomonadales bacterium]|nr:hypothetical protein [Pseudomonadales bacterium]